jgi:PPOX class probable FMN-dependent enzyme
MNQSDLRQLYGKPSELVTEAHVPFLDDTAQSFIRACRFLLISSSNEQGFVDISPRGGEPGFVSIVDNRTIEFLDMPGNKKILTFTNIINNSRVGLMFVVPGNLELLRAYGNAELITDKQQIAESGGNGENNKGLVRVHIKKVFPHCGKAITQAELWNPDSWQNEAASQVPGIIDMARGMASARQGESDD